MQIQKALHLYLEAKKRRPKFIDQTYHVFEKLDGWYGYLEPNSSIKSSSGRVIPSVQHFTHDFDGTLIFEILLSDVTDFPTLNGILNRKEKAKNAYLVVHDFVTNRPTPFHERHLLAKEIVYQLANPQIKIAMPLDITSDYNAWQYHADYIFKQGGEGIILKRSDAVYNYGKRNHTLMKIKKEVTADLFVCDIIEGEGKYKNTLGALELRDKANNTIYVSGMSDAERATWWAVPDLIIGKVVEIQAMERSSSGVYREPRFKAVRYDKTFKDID